MAAPPTAPIRPNSAMLVSPVALLSSPESLKSSCMNPAAAELAVGSLRGICSFPDNSPIYHRTPPQAAIHYHLPYSSLYGRINRLKREATTEWAAFRDLPDYSMEQDIDEADHSNGVDYRY